MELDCMMAEIDAIQCEPVNINHHSGDLSKKCVFDVAHTIREKLLEGPASILVVSHNCTEFDSKHQLSAATGMVNADRMRQLLEQAEEIHRNFLIEFPTWALTTASPLFKQGHEEQPGFSAMSFHMGSILPGYAMCVLDWYAQALQSNRWYEFLPDNPSVDSSDKWYWLYCYVTMRMLGMDDFTANLQELIESIISDLATNVGNYAHLLRALRPSDPIILQLAWYTAMQLQKPSPHLTDLDCQILAAQFPQFADSVKMILLAQ